MKRAAGLAISTQLPGFDAGLRTDRASQMGAGDDSCISLEIVDPLAQQDGEHIN